MDYQGYIGSERWRKNPARVRELETACGKYRLCASSEPSLQDHHRSYENLGFEIDGDLAALCGRCDWEVTSIIRRRKHLSRTPRRADVRRMRVYIDAELAKAHNGPTLVVTHHAPTIEAVAPQFRRSLTSAAYASELAPRIDRHQPEWWVSGHTHTSMNIRRGRTRQISNPCGYGDENPFFDPLFTIEVDHD